MKKLVFMFVAVAAIAEVVDSIVDSVAVDSVAADSVVAE